VDRLREPDLMSHDCEWMKAAACTDESGFSPEVDLFLLYTKTGY